MSAPEFPINCCVVLTVKICGAGVNNCAREAAGANAKLGVAAAGTKVGSAPARLTTGVTLTVARDTGAEVPCLEVITQGWPVLTVAACSNKNSFIEVNCTFFSVKSAIFFKSTLMLSCSNFILWSKFSQFEHKFCVDKTWFSIPFSSYVNLLNFASGGESSSFRGGGG